MLIKITDHIIKHACLRTEGKGWRETTNLPTGQAGVRILRLASDISRLI